MPVMTQAMPPEAAAERLYNLARRYGTRKEDNKRDQSGEGSDRCASGHETTIFSVKRGKLELTAQDCSLWNCCGNYSTSGGNYAFSDVDYKIKGRTVFSASRTNNGERYEDHLVSGESKTEKIPASGWKVTASDKTKKNLAQIIKELKQKLSRKRKH